MALKHLVLGILRQEPAHGYRVAMRLVALAGTVRRVEPARVYETLAALEREGSIAPARDVPGERGRRVWEATEKGRDELDRWLARPVPSADWLRRPLLVRLAVAGLGDPGRTAAARIELDARRRASARLEAAAGPGRIGSADPSVVPLHVALARADRERECARLRIEIELLEGWLDLAPEPASTGDGLGDRRTSLGTGNPPAGDPGRGSARMPAVSPPPRTPRRSPHPAPRRNALRSAPASR